MLTYADVCRRVLAYGLEFWQVRLRTLLTYADVCRRVLEYADVCWRVLTYAGVCWRVLTYADGRYGSSVYLLY